MKKSNIYNKVKRTAVIPIASLLLPLSSLFFTSCGDFLEIEPQDKIVLEKFWNEKADVDNVLIGCYSAMQTENVLDRLMVWGEFRSDNIEPGTNATDDVSLNRLINENIDATNIYTTYDGLYGVINRLNTVLHYAPQVAAKDPAYTQTMLKATEAEAKALRALCYFYLIRTFRDVPFVTEAVIDDNQDVPMEASKFDDILNSLIADLEQVKGDAMITYPDNQALYQTGRITQDAIHAMLCEMYLWKQDYQNCIKYADLVIDAKKKVYDEKYKGYTMDTDDRLKGYPLELTRPSGYMYYGNEFFDLFGRSNSRVDRGSADEIIFELVFMESTTMNQNISVNRFYATGPKSNAARGQVSPAAHLVIDENSSANLFNKLDARYYEGLEPLGSKLYRVGKYVNREVSINPISTTNIQVQYSFTQEPGHNHANWIVYRLTDIMLLKAEALVELGADGSQELKDAFELVQVVNNRALMEQTLTQSLKEPTKQEDMRELVLQERQRELLFEGKRWYDLVRRSLRDGNTDALTDAMSDKEMENSGPAMQRLKKIDAIFLPYNLEETRVNTKLVQNPAFSSGENDSFAKTSK